MHACGNWIHDLPIWLAFAAPYVVGAIHWVRCHLRRRGA